MYLSTGTKKKDQTCNTLKKKFIYPKAIAFQRFGQTFEVETDSSPVEVHPVRFQICDDRKVTPTFFTTRKVDIGERKYTVGKMEILTDVFALNQFLVYLLSLQPFQPIMDHEN